MVTDKIQDSVEITRWDRKYRDDFIRLNSEWIEIFFCLEESDLKILGDPEGEIIRKGGEIFLALTGGKAVGCCALICHPDTGRYELAKMAVSPAAQGKGIGFQLGAALLRYAGEHGITRIFLTHGWRLPSGCTANWAFRRWRRRTPHTTGVISTWRRFCNIGFVCVGRLSLPEPYRRCWRGKTDLFHSPTMISGGKRQRIPVKPINNNEYRYNIYHRRQSGYNQEGNARVYF